MASPKSPSARCATTERNIKCPAHVHALSTTAGIPILRMRATDCQRHHISRTCNCRPLRPRSNMPSISIPPMTRDSTVPQTMPLTPHGSDTPQPKTRQDEMTAFRTLTTSITSSDARISPTPRNAAPPTRVRLLKGWLNASVRRYSTEIPCASPVWF